MTKQEAIESMMGGNIVTHRYFTEDEFILLDGKNFRDEGGCILNPTEFWSYRTEESWNNGWEIYKPKE